MQDKDLHTDKNFTDRAWQEMHFLLDKEMPVKEKNKKRPLLFWFSGISGIAALLVGIYFFNFSEKNTEKLIYENKVTAIINEAKSKESYPETKDQSEFINKKEEKNIELKSAANQNTNNNRINSLIIKEESKSKSRLKNPIAANEPISNLNKKLESVSNENKIINSITVTDNFRSEYEPHQNYAVKETINKPEKAIVSETPHTPNHLNPIDKIEQLTLEEIKWLNKINPAYLNKNKSKNNHTNTLFASNLFMIGSKTRGFSVGYLRDIKTINNNWSVNAGVGYKYIAQPIEYTLTEVTTAPADTSGLGVPEASNDLLVEVGYANTTTSRLLDFNGDPTSFNSGSSDIPFNKLKLHYLTVPLNVKYRKNRFWLSGGIQASILLVANNSSFTGGIAKEIGLTSDKSEENFLNGSSNNRTNPSIPNLSNLDLSATLGTGFSISKKLDLHLSYLHGLKDVIKNNVKKDYNRLFQLSMQYNW